MAVRPKRPSGGSNRRRVAPERFGLAAMLFLPAIVLIALAGTGLYLVEVRSERESVAWQDERAAELLRDSLQDDVDAILAETLFLAQEIEASGVFGPGAGLDPKAMADMTRMLGSFASKRRVYDQLRLVDQAGIERIRVNHHDGRASVVEKGWLQDKSNRYYLRAALAKRRGEIFVSPFDLNVEHGEVEVPHKPMIRFGTPVFDAAGRKRGIFLLNYLGRDLLSRVSRLQFSEYTTAYLLDSHGYYLKGPTPESEWGFMFPERQACNFGKDHPEAWTRITERDETRLELDSGLYTVRRISWGDPESPRDRGPWRLVAFAPQSRLAKYASTLATGISIAFCFAGVVLAVMTWILAGAVLARQASDRSLRQNRS